MSSSNNILSVDGNVLISGSIFTLVPPLAVGDIRLVTESLPPRHETITLTGGNISLPGGTILTTAGSTGPTGGSITLTGGSLPCYAAGTHILTQSGEVPIEALSPGDLIVTCLGQGAMLKPVLWIGRRRVTPSQHPEPRRARPIRIRQGALSDGVPRRDLVVSPSHALFIDGHLVRAESLVNGATITQESWPEVEYLHVELAAHDVILAEGAPAETYRDDGNRAIFGPTPVSAPATPPPVCAPVLADTAPLARALMARAVALGWQRLAQPAPWLLLDGQVIQAESPGRFRLPPGGTSLRLLSSAARLGAMGSGTDGRILGLALVRLTLGQVAVTADDPRLGRGFHGLERAEAGAFRWTDGDADLTAALAEALPRGGVLEITDCGASPAWAEPAETLRRRA
ncbi:Hint domain-containing protein [Humitalea sp. 24SJ18S-53]|uniref:Hint domain-containing protein n=1 Tax=Humitalea sp. 24SJ18S-53 TaxID=3422307 RepID=UPI003D67600E